MICELLSARIPHQLDPDLGTDLRRYTQPKNQNNIFLIILFDYPTLDGVNNKIQIYLLSDRNDLYFLLTKIIIF